MEIREIEKIIDEAHKTHEEFKLPKNQAMHDVLASFEEWKFLKIDMHSVATY